MPCYSPWRAFLGREGQVVPVRARSPSQAPLTVGCGRCMGCRLDKAREWGLRIAHEASLHEESSFLTLTYRDEELPYNASVSLRELQLFFKRLRERIAPQKVRYYGCGEYGGVGERPHYHCILFGYGFPDKTIWRRTRTGAYTYRSALLESVWPFGHAEIGTVTRQSGAYVARYVLKKVGGKHAEEYYSRVHPVTGLVHRVDPEFAVMSSKPGIGAEWFDKWHADVLPSGFCVVDGKKVPVPRYYKDRSEYLKSISKFKARSREYVKAHGEDLTDERLEVRGEVQRLKQEKFKRDLGEV